MKTTKNLFVLYRLDRMKCVSEMDLYLEHFLTTRRNQHPQVDMLFVKGIQNVEESENVNGQTFLFEFYLLNASDRVR